MSVPRHRLPPGADDDEPAHEYVLARHYDELVYAIDDALQLVAQGRVQYAVNRLQQAQTYIGERHEQ